MNHPSVRNKQMPRNDSDISALRQELKTTLNKAISEMTQKINSFDNERNDIKLKLNKAINEINKKMSTYESDRNEFKMSFNRTMIEMNTKIKNYETTIDELKQQIQKSSTINITAIEKQIKDTFAKSQKKLNE